MATLGEVFNHGTVVSRPGAGVKGRYWLDSTTTPMVLYYDDGADWLEVEIQAGSSVNTVIIKETDGTPTVSGYVFEFDNGTVTTISGGAHIQNTLTVKEQDGNPTISGVRTLQISGGTVTDNGNGAVTVNITGGGISGIGVKEVDGSPSLTGITVLSFNGAQVQDNGGGEALITISGGNGGGAPSTARYIVASGDSNLSAEIIIPGLSGSADRLGIGGAGFSYEFDSGSSPLTWSTAVDVENVGSTLPSHLYVYDTDTTARMGLFSYSPAGDWEVTTKIAFTFDPSYTSNDFYIGIIATNSDESRRIAIMHRQNSATPSVEVYTYAGSFTLQNSIAITLTGVPVYFKLRYVAGSTAVHYYYSFDGMSWRRIGGAVTFSLTAAKIGFYYHNSSGGPGIVMCDWLRGS